MGLRYGDLVCLQRVLLSLVNAGVTTPDPSDPSLFSTLLLVIQFILSFFSDAGCHWEMEREAFLHPISRLLMWVGMPEKECPYWWIGHGKKAWLQERSCSSIQFRRECPDV
ncbi:hypothetical protein TNCV_2891171 [Trichonephila clavipes]|nr:hypothetical protein TNCV_2891171 [Trichonephila clavipes]